MVPFSHVLFAILAVIVVALLTGISWNVLLLVVGSFALCFAGMIVLIKYQANKLRETVDYTKLLATTDRHITFEIHYYDGKVVKKKVSKTDKEEISVLLGRLR